MLLESPYPWPFASAIASSKSPNEATPTIGPKVSVRVDRVVARDAVDDRGVEEQALLGIADESLAGFSAVIRPDPGGPQTRCDAARSGRATSRSDRRSAARSSARRAPLRVGSPIAAARVAASNRATNSSWIDPCTMAVPSDVHRWPAVPNPLNNAPSTARSRSASGMTTSGFLPPSSRHGVCRCRPASSPMPSAHLARTGEPDLVHHAFVERPFQAGERLLAVGRAPG